MRRGDKIKFILESLQQSAIAGTDLLVAFLKAGYGASMSTIQYKVDEEQRARYKKIHERNAVRIERQRYFNLISALKKDGLVLEERKQGRNIFILTPSGKQKLSSLRTQAIQQLPHTIYHARKHNLLTIIAFDIPEPERKKRAWVRSALTRMGFTMLQMSVWVGKIKLPAAFLDDIKLLKLGTHVEIFEVTKAGSLRYIR